MAIKRVVLDVLIPINITAVNVSERLAKLSGVKTVDVAIQEVERKVETATITIEGNKLNLDRIRKELDKLGASLQSIDRITSEK